MTVITSPRAEEYLPVISLHQPWATLWVSFFKRYETRDWALGPQFVGKPLLVHAAKKWDTRGRNLAMLPFVGEHLAEMGFPAAALRKTDLPLGAIIGAVQVEANFKTEVVRNVITREENTLGDFSPGRFAWKSRHSAMLREPVPFGGRQRLFYATVQQIFEAEGSTILPCRMFGWPVEGLGRVDIKSCLDLERMASRTANPRHASR